MTRADLWLLLFTEPSYRHEIHLRAPERNPAACWIPVEQKVRFERLLDADDCWVSAIPRRIRYDDLSWGDASMLWALLPSPASCTKLERFQPTPTFVWREGRSSRRVAVWSLSRPLRARFVLQATERLAHALGARRKAASPSALIPSPFSGRWAPEFESLGVYTPRQIVGGLRDAPDPNAWKAAA